MAISWSEEQKAVLECNKNVLVSASAGSGKTTVMLERVFRLLKDGADLRRILMMTFTKASAREMKEKLVKQFYKEEKLTNDENIKKQMENLPFASISTIDSFCYGLMQKYFNLVGVDPSASFGEESAMQLAETECYQKAISSCLTSGDEEMLKTIEFFRSKRSYDSLIATMKKIITCANSSVDIEQFFALCESDAKEVSEKYYVKHRSYVLPYAISLAEEALEYVNAGEDIKNASDYISLYDLLCKLKETKDIQEFFDIIDRIPRITKTGNKKVSPGFKETNDQLAPVVQNLVKTIKDDKLVYMDDSKSEQQAFVKKSLVKLCKEGMREYVEYKKKRNLVDFNDTMRYAIQILDDENAREAISSNYDYVFVDEYQDTSYLQEELLNKIKGSTIFAVGDLKQAIYHFRSAEPQIFANRRARYQGEEEGVNRLLNTNYRSVKGVLDFTNDVCSEIMIDEFCGIDYKNTSVLNWGNQVTNVGDEPTVQVYVYEQEKAEKNIPTGVYRVKTADKIETGDETESEFIVHKINHFVNNVEIIEDGKVRKIGYGDIAVLMQTGPQFIPVKEAFKKHGIPFYSTKENKDVMPERELLVDCLRVVLNANNDIPLYSVLVSPMFNFNAEEMMTLRENAFDGKNQKSLWDTLIEYKGEPKLENKITEALEYLEKLRIEAGYKKASEVLKSILKKNLDAEYLRKGDDVISEINDFVKYVATLPCDRSVEEFIEYYDVAYSGNVGGKRKDAVALMTMHGSKGLEFPVVFLPYLHRDRNKKGIDNAKVEIEKEFGLAVRAYDEEEKEEADTFLGITVKLKNADEERKEHARLMYVAFTRARNYLILTGRKSKDFSTVFEGNSIMNWIEYAAKRNAHVSEKIKPLVIEGKVGNGNGPVKQKKFDFSRIERKYAYESAVRQPVKYSVSEILAKDAENSGSYNLFIERKSEKARSFGTAFHTVMQKIDLTLDTEEKIASSLDELLRQGFINSEERKAISESEVLAVLNSSIIKDAVKFGCMREQPFVLYQKAEESEEKVLIQGVVDLIITYDDGYAVVDFKTGNASEEKMKERYSKQLDLYARSVEKITGKQVNSKVIFAISQNKVFYL